MIPKFKAWDKYHEMMVSIISFDFERKIAYVGREDGDRWEIHFDNLNFMQSPDLNDKNGTEIYEGDILLYTSKSINYGGTYWHSYVQVYRMDNGAYRIKGEHIYDTELMSVRKHVEVVGNIYENAELLNKDRFMTEY